MNRKRDLNSVYAWARAIAGNTSQQQQQTTTTKKKKNTSKRREEEIKAEAEADQCIPPRIKIHIDEGVEEKKDAESQANTYSISDEQKTQNEREEGRGIDDEEEEEVWNIPSDTDAALMMMHAQFPDIRKMSMLPFVLVSQLYSAVKDRTVVDRELEILKQQSTVRIFKLSSGQDDYAIMYFNDYVEQIKLAKESVEGKHTGCEMVIFDWYKDHVLPTYVDVGITQTHFESLLAIAGCHIQENHISLLIKTGLLVRQLADQKSYWFAIPNIGFILKNLAQGRKEVFSLLNRRQYKGLLLSSLEKKTLRTSQLGMRFHIRDLLGSGKLCLSNTPSGLLVCVPRD